MSDLLIRAENTYYGLIHCYNDRGCVRCPMYDVCQGDCTVAIGEAADVIAELLHERMVQNGRPD